VSDWSVRDVLLFDGHKYGIYGQAVADYTCDVRGYADAPSSSTAIVQINGKSKNGKIRVTGTSTDTATALIGGDFPNQTFLFPNDEGGLDFDQTKIHDLDLQQCKFEVVRLAGAAGIWYRNTTINNVQCEVISPTGQIVSVYSDTVVYLGGETNVAGLVIDGLSYSKTHALDVMMVRFENQSANVSSGLVLRNIELSAPAEENGLGPVRFLSGNWRDVTIDNAFQRNPTWQGMVVVATGSAAINIQNLTVRNTHLRINNALKNTAWRSAILGTGNANAVFESVLIENCSVVDVSSGGTKAGVVINVSGSALRNLRLRGIRVDGTLDVAYCNVTGATSRWILDDIETNNCSFVVRCDMPLGEVQIGSMRHITNVTDVVRISFSTATMRVNSLGGLPRTAPTSGKHVNVAAGSANFPECNGADMLCDTAQTASVTGSMIRSSATSRVQEYNGSAWVNVT